MLPCQSTTCRELPRNCGTSLDREAVHVTNTIQICRTRYVLCKVQPNLTVLRFLGTLWFLFKKNC